VVILNSVRNSALCTPEKNIALLLLFNYKSFQNPGSGLRARRKPMKKRSINLEYETFEERPILAKYKEGEKKTRVFGL